MTTVGSTAPTARASDRLRLGLVGVGKMGLSHLAIAGTHDLVEVVGVCDSQPFLLAGLRSQRPIATFKRLDEMLADAEPDALVVATPTPSHFELASDAVSRGLSVFVEKPLTLSAAQSHALAQAAADRGVANQVGYHNRFIATFQEAARLVAEGAIGTVHHVDGRAFGPVVTRAGAGGYTWRSRRGEGGGCLHDYASHVVDLMNFVVGPPSTVVAATFTSIHSQDVEDAVNALLRYDDGATGSIETNWSDPSHRKMTTTITIHGATGKIVADRQELRVHLDEDTPPPEGYQSGWNVRYITELQAPVWFYLRGEEYSAQLDTFVRDARAANPDGPSSFATAAETDRVVEAIAAAAERDHAPTGPSATTDRTRRWTAWLRDAPIPDRTQELATAVAARIGALRRTRGR